MAELLASGPPLRPDIAARVLPIVASLSAVQHAKLTARRAELCSWRAHETFVGLSLDAKELREAEREVEAKRARVAALEQELQALGDGTDDGSSSDGDSSSSGGISSGGGVGEDDGEDSSEGEGEGETEDDAEGESESEGGGGVAPVARADRVLRRQRQRRRRRGVRIREHVSFRRQETRRPRAETRRRPRAETSASLAPEGAPTAAEPPCPAFHGPWGSSWGGAARLSPVRRWGRS